MINIIDAIYKLYPNVVRTIDAEAFDADGNKVSYDLGAVTVQAKKDNCKAQAKQLLAATDWAALPDVGLSNAIDFKTYRATLRDLVLNPVENPTFPTVPTPVWE